MMLFHLLCYGPKLPIFVIVSLLFIPLCFSGSILYFFHFFNLIYRVSYYVTSFACWYAILVVFSFSQYLLVSSVCIEYVVQSCNLPISLHFLLSQFLLDFLVFLCISRPSSVHFFLLTFCPFSLSRSHLFEVNLKATTTWL